MRRLSATPSAARLALLALALALAPTGHAASASVPEWKLPGLGVESYGTAREPGPLSRLAAEEAASALGRAVTPESSLEDAARTLAAGVLPGCRSWPVWMEEPVLLHSGWTDGNTAAILFCASHVSERDVLKRLRKRLPDFPRTTHLGAARVSAGWIESVWVVLLDERPARVAPFPRRLDPGQEAWFAFALDRGLDKPRVYHMDASGSVRQLEVLGGKAPGEFAARFSSDVSARHWLELMASGKAGPTVLALFPVYVGVPVPEAVSREPELEIRAETPADAERIMLRLANRERARRGIAPMRLDDRLARIARGYSQRQRATGRIAHISPDGQGPGERAAAAGYAARILAENLAKGEGVIQAHEGLMGSPAHRAAILDPQFTHAGIGVAIAREHGGKAFYVTEMFAVPQRELSRAEARAEVVGRIRGLRSGLGVSRVLEDPVLNGVARRLLRSRDMSSALDQALRHENIQGKVSASRQEVSDPRELTLPSEFSVQGRTAYGLEVEVRSGEGGLNIYSFSLVVVTPLESAGRSRTARVPRRSRARPRKR